MALDSATLGDPHSSESVSVAVVSISCSETALMTKSAGVYFEPIWDL